MIFPQHHTAVQQQFDFAGKIFSLEPVIDLLYQVHLSLLLFPRPSSAPEKHGRARMPLTRLAGVPPMIAGNRIADVKGDKKFRNLFLEAVCAGVFLARCSALGYD